MQRTILDEIKESFRTGTNLNKLLLINVGVYLIIKIIGVICFLFRMPSFDSFVISWFAVPSNVIELMYKPWTIITYMFLHIEFLHILFNMLWLFWFGKIFSEYLGENRLIPTYILGGLAGAILYILAYNIFPVFRESLPFSVAMGASASVLAIVLATAAYIPEYSIQLMFIGNVKLKYIAIFTVVLDLLSISGGNPGGHIAHLGGAFWGYIYILQLKKGYDISAFFNNIFRKRQYIKKVKPQKSRIVTDEEYNYNKAQQQKRVDQILDKISKSGYQSLTKEEKEFLFNASGKKK
ncbi:MAG: rhomboid family intramembrane serine protease [Bacteroidota bacterium]|nr:rhomboid family intramembrane serine protease [Bacteroidota bacterium]